VDTLTWLLITAREGGVTVQPDGDRLTMKGPKNHRTVAHLRQHKAAIKEFYAGLDERLRRGQQWLVRAHKELWDKEGWPVGTPSMVEAFDKNLDTWDALDSLVEPRHCPIGGCDPSSPAVCRSCESNGRARGTQSSFPD
jgi:hypothetical protein